MDKQKAGIVIFMIGALYLLVISGLGGYGLFVPSKVQITEITAHGDKIVYFVWSFSAPIASILTGIGILLYVKAKGSRIALFALGIFLVFLFAGFFLLAPDVNIPHYPKFFGITGGLMLVLFLLVMWFWAKKRANLKGLARTGADFHLVSYVFFLLATWYLCGTFSALFKISKIRSPVHIMIFLLLGWVFLFLGHYKYARALQK
jgi:hypothetical protein